jgi:E-phenylitaconyl-CoA hydratase
MPPIEYRTEGKIAIWTINRPEALNALSPQAISEWTSSLIEFRDNKSLWVGIVTGAGEKAFCTGLDLKSGGGGPPPGGARPGMPPGGPPPGMPPGGGPPPGGPRPGMPPGGPPPGMPPGGGPPPGGPRPGMPPGGPPAPQATLVRGLELWKPIIAAVNGYAFGGGFEIALACDIRIASDNARFGLTEVTLGLIPGWGGSQRLPRMIPFGKAAELLLMGKRIDANEALALNIVSKVVPQKDLMSTAIEWANQICQCAPLAVQAAKEAMMRGINMTLADGLALESELGRKVTSSKDFAEGRKAFAEKRTPNYIGE